MAISQGVKVVTTAGTDVVLATSRSIKWIIIQAQTDNTGFVSIGASGVDATVATGTGIALAAGESLTLPGDDLANIYIDATVSGEGVRFTYGY
jgi:2-succinyl-5-enolpyruvyl-6-hydroxy-3-cyclohexene-1-carboxylate synthase